MFVGIDVSAKRGQAVAVLDHSLGIICLEVGQTCEGTVDKVLEVASSETIIAIDAPRRSAKGRKGKGGRDCERQLHKMGARPQWTPPAGANTPEWMRVGFRLFREFERQQVEGRVAAVIEAFPSPSYGRFPDLQLSLPVRHLQRREKADQLDAICCALVAWCYANGYYELVGDTAEGEIILPSPGKKAARVVGAQCDALLQERPNRPDRSAACLRVRPAVKNTTERGFINRNGQEVIRRTDLMGTDHGQRVYALRCRSCGQEYGANGSDIHLRKCPRCQGGRSGLSLE